MKAIADLLLKDIRTDGGTQCRVFAESERDEVAAGYAQLLQQGEDLCSGREPIVFRDAKKNNWLADGHLRYQAHGIAGLRVMRCEIRPGSQRDAILFSTGANRTHGLTRTNADKRNAVLILLNDPEWCKWSGRKIAAQAGVAEGLVRKLRCELSAYNTQTGEVSNTEPEEEDELAKQLAALDLPTDILARLKAMTREQRAEFLRLAEEEGKKDEKPLTPKQKEKAEKTLARHLLDRAKPLVERHWPATLKRFVRVRQELAR